ncbi:MAG TPA: DUF1524 domain-containing protein, partial [Candidatus Saccharimonadales bacterium]|nr:DUF1524 domain-containing protein [Candidatus Saccharimonadales bacterium]
IFESINATGEPLSTADLLRNFLLLEIGSDKQEEYYRNYWLVIERNVGNENISDYIRRYLTLKTNEDVKKDTEYKEFKKKYKEYFGNAEEAIEELAHFSKYYRWIKRPELIDKEHASTGKLLQDLDDLRMLPATPTIMWLLERADRGKIEFKDVNKTFEVIASWSFRARITNIINTGEIGNILTTRILEILKNKKSNDTYAEYLWFELSNYRLRDIYPSNAMFKEAFVRYDFYKNYRQYVQVKLSEALSNDQTEIVLESIEHIMPQTINSKKWPGITMSEHAEWVNTIGNLTPLNMPDNIDNSNHSFADKIPNIKKSDWQITRNIDTSDGWNISSIQKRAHSLADVAIKVWLAPLERTREIEVARLGVKTNRYQKFADWIVEFSLPYIALDLEHSTSSYLRFTTDFMDSLIPKRKSEDGGWRSGHAYYYELKSEASGWTRINLAFNSESLTHQQQSGQRIVMEFLGKKPSNEAWIWFNTIGWTLNFDEGDETLKDDVKRILEEEIPRLEHDIKNFQKEKINR